MLLNIRNKIIKVYTYKKHNEKQETAKLDNKIIYKIGVFKSNIDIVKLMSIK